MESAPIRFTVEMADVPFEVRCFYPETKEHLKDFLTEKEPEFVIDHADKANLEVRRGVERFVEFNKEEYSNQSKDEVDRFIEDSSTGLLIGKWLSPYGILRLHGSAVCFDSEVYIFTAPSGTGKSTHTALWCEVFGDRAWMLNGDKPFLRLFDNGSVRVYGSPWKGKENLGKNTSAPLKAISWLMRGNENSIELLTKKKAYPLLMTQMIKSLDKGWVSAIMRMTSDLLDRIPFYYLRCNKDPEAACISMKEMSSGKTR